MHNKCRLFLALAIITLAQPNAYSQQAGNKKYPSLLWEITGNGLSKPSYLFGTMHVSSKMVFHLSDSFYRAIGNVDAVALELNPDVWQGQMVRLDQLKQNYSDYSEAPGNDFLTENSFRILKYEDELKAALSTEPSTVNSLLYRTYKAKEDFEEDTFLDLYIYQTGRKLGKRGTGVENYYETEKIVLEAYADMAMEKKKKTVDTDGESMADIQEKMQAAYRRGDLDLMDSLDIMTEESNAFREKFLYKRNEIQANSIDTILKKSSLFVGVGASHLPGPRGVIELLRQKGYRLRPIKMTDRDAAKKEMTDKMKVPVVFSTTQSDDGFYSVSLPGPLFKLAGENNNLDRRQYSDMSNGSYYLVTRVKTHAGFIGQKEKDVQAKIDSLLYENIPGKILTKKIITRNGYTGFDIVNKTRRGDIQRYNLFITHNEIIIFKMSGKDHYVEGPEADKYFGSIQLKESPNTPLAYTPKQGGFTVKLPQTPTMAVTANTGDGLKRREFEATDKTTGDAYLIFEKTVYNFKFLEEDTFDLKLVEESFRSPDFFERQIERKPGSINGYPCLDVKEKMKDSSIVHARYLLQGPHYYVLAVRTRNTEKDFSSFFQSFSFSPFKYESPKNYADTFLHFTVQTPVIPEFDDAYRDKLENVTNQVTNSSNYSSYNTYWPKQKNGLFTDESTGETIGVGIQPYPKYFSIRDSIAFWKNEVESYYDKKDLVLHKKDSFRYKDGSIAFRFVLRDTGSSRTIERLVTLKGEHMFSVVTMGDTLGSQSLFTQSFFNSFEPDRTAAKGRNVFVNRLDSFFSDLFSKDSTTHARAFSSLSSLYYGETGLPKIIQALKKLSPADKDYFETKTKLIAELGYIRDTLHPAVTGHLKTIYEQVGDTALFQNEVFEALARHQTESSVKLFKELVLQDPPIFDNSYDYTSLFTLLKDSLKLTTSLYPDLLQLTTLDDYKEPVISLLVNLVDSGLVTSVQYESYLSKLIFDARIEAKKQLAKDEKKMQEESKKEDSDEPVRNYSYGDTGNALDDYAVLLMPFYDKNSYVPRFFDKLLASRDETVRLNAATIMLRHNKPVADSILTGLAKTDQFRGRLYKRLETINRLDRFPQAYRSQLAMARSFLVADKDYNKMDSIELVGKQAAGYDGKKGIVYFFRYRIKKEDDWKIGLSGLQPENPDHISSDDRLAVMTDKKIKEEKPVNEQFQYQLKKILFNFHKSAKNFFDSDSPYKFTKVGEYGER